MRAKSLAALIFCVAVTAAQAQAPVQTGVASFYGRESGPRTASGERFDPDAMTAAHRTLPFGTLVRVCYPARASGLAGGASAGRCVVVRINDRGPFVRGRDIDLSAGAARRIRLPGVAAVTIEVLRASDVYIPKHGDWGVF
jgi:rare lipoprotein A